MLPFAIPLDYIIPDIMFRILEKLGPLYYAAWIILQPLKRFREISGINNIPKSGPAIIIANHVGLTDPWKIGPHLPFRLPVYWLGKSELFNLRKSRDEYRKLGPFSWLFAVLVVLTVRLSLTIPVDRDNHTARTNKRAYRQSLQLLRKNRTIGIYPEGGIDRKGEVHPMFVSLAQKTASRIHPVAISDGRIVFLEPITIEAGVRDHKATAVDIMEKIYSCV